MRADEIKRLRFEAGLTQRQLADAAKLTQAYISQIESGASPLTANAERRIESALRMLAPSLAERQAVRVLSGGKR